MIAMSPARAILRRMHLLLRRRHELLRALDAGDEDRLDAAVDRHAADRARVVRDGDDRHLRPVARHEESGAAGLRERDEDLRAEVGRDLVGAVADRVGERARVDPALVDGRAALADDAVGRLGDRAIMRTDSTGNFPEAVSAESMTASVPS